MLILEFSPFSWTDACFFNFIQEDNVKSDMGVVVD